MSDTQAIIDHAEHVLRTLPPDTHRWHIEQLCRIAVKLAQAIETRRRIEPAPTNILEPTIVTDGEVLLPCIFSTADESECDE